MTTISVNPTNIAGLETVFRDAIKALRTLKQHFKDGVLEPELYSVRRDMHLNIALRAVAGLHGVTLASPLQVHGNSEFCITAMPADGALLTAKAGPFGTFAELLNRHAPHNGLARCTLGPSSGMCFMNDVNVEEMVLEHAGTVGL